MAPLRDFVCQDCEHDFEAIDTEDELMKCRECDSFNVKALVSAPGGYHITGHNSGSTRPRNSGSFKRSNR